MNSFFIGVLLLFLSSIFAILCNKNFKIKLVSFFSIISAVLCITPATQVLFGEETLSKSYLMHSIFGNVNFIIDPLSAFFILIISLISCFGIVYANGYLKPYIEKDKNISAHLIFLTTLISSMLLVVTCQNALMFLICWEIMSLSSFFLVIFENEKKEILKAGIKYLVFMHISVIFIIIAFAMLSLKSGSLDFHSFAPILQENKIFANTIFFLAFVGFGTKAGFVPFHNWLPDAHPSAPSHVSAIMSGIMIKTGLYGILRLISLIAIPSKLLAFTVILISVITALYGILYAISQHDLKRLFAYSSIENIGIIGIGIGTGMIGLTYGNNIVATLGFSGALLHILNHSIFKQLLFLLAGSVYLKTHTRDIEKLGGLIKSMPITGTIFLLGSIAICALPPFNGFISEFLIYFAMLKGLEITNFFVILALIFTIGGLAFVGTMAILCFTKAFSIVFLGMPRSEASANVLKDVNYSMTIPTIILAVLCLLIGLCPQFVVHIINLPITVLSYNSTVHLNIPVEILQQISTFTLVLLGLIIAITVLRLRLCKNKIQYYETWGCGYDRPNKFMQYTASSYASPFLSMLKPLFKKVFDIEKPKRLFPRSAHFALHIDDIEEAYVIHPLVKFDEWFLSKFEKLQSGNIQTYIKYGLIFLVAIIIGCLVM